MVYLAGMKTLLLASRSPRRQAMLRQAGWAFRADAVDTDESVPPGLTPAEAAMHIAGGKALASAPLRRASEILLAADTVVALGTQLLAKPADADEATAMLSLLSGKTHEVITAVVLQTDDHTETFYSRTEVDVAPLSQAAITHYVVQYRPFDKAGAYAIQEWIGLTHILAIRGCYYNVVGLPMPALHPKLQALGARWEPGKG
jgi:septum formation protein